VACDALVHSVRAAIVIEEADIELWSGDNVAIRNSEPRPSWASESRKGASVIKQMEMDAIHRRGDSRGGTTGSRDEARRLVSSRSRWVPSRSHRITNFGHRFVTISKIRAQEMAPLPPCNGILEFISKVFNKNYEFVKNFCNALSK